MPITVSPLSEAIGARIEGVDLSRELDPASIRYRQGTRCSSTPSSWSPARRSTRTTRERFCRYFGELEMVRSGQALGAATIRRS